MERLRIIDQTIGREKLDETTSEGLRDRVKERKEEREYFKKHLPSIGSGNPEKIYEVSSQADRVNKGLKAADLIKVKLEKEKTGQQK